MFFFLSVFSFGCKIDDTIYRDIVFDSGILDCIEEMETTRTVWVRLKGSTDEAGVDVPSLDITVDKLRQILLGSKVSSSGHFRQKFQFRDNLFLFQKSSENLSFEKLNILQYSQL